jgi:hypothetical protein
MTKSLYYLFFAVILFTSCKDEDDTAPQDFLNDTYEVVGENTDTGIWYVRQYAFKADGTYEYFILLRESESGSDLGYSYYIKGTYTLRGQELVTKVTESFALDYEAYPDGYAESLSDLEAQDILPQYAESKGVLKRMNDGEKISLVFECNDILASCVGEQVYDRVD